MGLLVITTATPSGKGRGAADRTFAFLRARHSGYVVAHAAGISVLSVTARHVARSSASGDVPPTVPSERTSESLADGTPIIEVLGAPNPEIYDWQLSPYTIDLAVALATRLEAMLVYASLTDFVQHAAAPGEAMADEFYRAIDVSIGGALDAGFVVGLAADHGMRAKVRADGGANVRFLDEALADAGVRGVHTLCPITDPYVSRAPRGARGRRRGSHLDDLDELDRARGVLAGLSRRRGGPRPLGCCSGRSSCRATGSRTHRAGGADASMVWQVPHGARSQRALDVEPLRSHGGSARTDGANDLQPPCATARCVEKSGPTVTCTTFCSTTASRDR